MLRNSRISRHRQVLLSTVCFTAGALICAGAIPTIANPLDGKVSAGQATISEAGKKLDVHQQSDRAVIDWRAFDVAPDEHTRFYQPGASSVTLNRVNTDRVSHIDGQITANGNVVIINQNGIVFGKDAQVDVNGLLATTADTSNENFMRGQMKFDRPGNPNASVVNEGTITAKEAGLVGLVAPNVANSGTINAKMGRVHLGSGDTATVDLYGDGLMEIAVSGDVESQTVTNTGKINADGGKVAITAATGKDIVNSLVTVEGEINAKSVGEQKGEILISADKGKRQVAAKVVVKAKLDASGKKAGEKGGKVTVTGDDISIVTGSIVDVSGHSAAKGAKAGGEILIGGDYKGSGKTPTAQKLFVDYNTSFFADAISSGDAGRAIFWSDKDTVFKGNVYARGGALGGNGGFVETSGKQNLQSSGFVDLTAILGDTGLWFLDPTNISIFNRSGSGDLTNTFTTAQLETMSASANVALSATNNITLDLTGDTMNFTTSGRTFGLTASNQILTASAGTITTTNGAITLTGTSGINLSNSYTFNSGGGAINIASPLTLGAAQTFNSGGGTITTSSTVNGAQNLTVNAGTGTFATVGIIGGSTALNNLSVTADGVTLGANVGGTGALSFTPYSVGTTVGLAGGAGTFNLDATEQGRLVNGWSSIAIGRTDGTGAMTVNAATWNDPLTLSTGSGVITVAGTETMGANALTIQTDGDFTLTGALTGTGNLSLLPSSAATTIGLGGGAGTLGLTTTEIGKITNGWGSISIGRADGTGALTAAAATWNDFLTLITGSGAMSVTGTQTMGANNLTLQTDSDLSLTGALTGTGALFIKPSAAATTIGLGGGAGTLGLTTTELSQITNGWASITIGSTAMTGALTAAAATWSDVLTLITGSGAMSVTGTQTMSANNLTLQTDSDLSLTGALTGTGTLTVIPTTASTSIGLGGGAGTLGLTTTELSQITNGWTSLVFGNATMTGALTAAAATWNDILTLITGSGAMSVTGTQTMAANNLTLQTDSDLSLTGALTGTGALVIKPSAAATSIGLGGAAGTLSLTATELSQITNGWASIAIGSATMTGALTAAAATWNDPLTLQTLSGVMSVTGAQTMAANALTLVTDSDLSITGALTGTGALSIRPTSAATTIGLGGGAGTLNLSSSDLSQLTDGWTSITIGSTSITGAITANAVTWNDPLSLINAAGLMTIAGEQTMGANALTLQTDSNLTLNGALTGSGILTLQTTTAATTIGLGGGAGTFNLTAGEIGQITDGWSSILLGNTTGTGAMTLNALTWNDPLTLRSAAGVMTVAGEQTMGANNLTIQTNGDLALNAALTGSGTLAIQPTTAATTMGFGGGAGTLGLTTTEIAQITDGWSSILMGSSAMTGAMTVNAATWSDPLSFITAAGVITVAGAQTMGANNLTIQTNGDPVLNAALTGSGILTLMPTSAATTIGLAGGTGTLGLDATELTRLTDGWASIVIGSTAGTGAMTVNAATWNDPLTLRSAAGVITVAGTQTMGANNLTVQTDGNLGLSVGANLTGTGALTIKPTTASTTVGLAGGAGTLALTATELSQITDGWASITFGSSASTGLMTLGTNATTWNDPLTLLSGSGNIAFAGNQTFAANNSLTVTPSSGSVQATSATVITTSGTGGITFNGPTALTAALTLNSGSGGVSTTGAINGAQALTVATGTGTFTTGAAIGATTALTNLSITADSFSFGGNLKGTGTLTLRPASLGVSVGVAGGTGDFNLDSTVLSLIQSGFSGIVIGRNDSTADMNLNAYASWNTALTLYNGSGNINFAGSQTLAASKSLTVTPTSGAMQISSASTFTTSGTGAITLSGPVTLADNLTLNSGSGGVTTSSTLNGAEDLTINASTGTYTSNGIIGGSTALNNFSVTADGIALGTNISGTGTFTAQQTSAATTVGLAGGTGTFNLSATELGYIQNGWSLITLGSVAGTGAYAVNAATWNDPLTLRSAAGIITLAGAQTMNANDLTIQTDGNLVVSANLTGTGALTIRPTSVGTTMGVAGGAGTLGLTTTELAFIQSGFSGINLGRDDGTGLMTVNAYALWNTALTLYNGSGNIAFAGSQTLPSNKSLTATTTTGLIQTTGAATLTTSGTGNIALNGPVSLGAATVVTTGSSGTTTFGGTVNGGFNLTGTSGTYSLASAFGGSTPLSAVSLTSTNSLTLPSITAASLFARTTGASADITIPSGKALTVSGSGTPLTVVAAGNFINNAGSGALSASSGRWLAYSTDPANDTIGSLSNAFRRFTCTYGGSCPSLGSGNGLLYTTTPILTATPSAINTTYSSTVSLSGYSYGLSGYLGSDSGSDVVTGSLTGTTTYTQGANVGSYNVNYTSGTLTSPMGYGFSYANNATAITVAARTLTATLTGTVSRVYDATTAAALVAGNYILSNIYNSDDVSLSNTASGTYNNKNIGTGKTVSVSGLTLAGAKAGNYVLASDSINGAVGTITAKGLTATVTADNKVYDRTTVATGSTGALIGIAGSDTVNFTGTDTYSFANKNVGTGKTVTVAGLSLNGADAGNYTLGALTGTADITAKALSISGVTANNKVYDRLTTVALTTAGDSLTGVIAGDTVTLDNSGSSASFADKTVGTAKAVTASGFAIGGADVANYSLTQPTGLTANITAKALSISGVTANNKVYDRLTTAALTTAGDSLSGVISGDTVTLDNSGSSASFANKTVGTAKAVTASGFAISGADASNYSLAQPTGLTADITAKGLTISGVTANNKEYDRLTTATLDTSSDSLNGVISGDTVAFDDSVATGSFANKNVGAAKTVTASGFAISGADASNYTLSQPTGLTADITTKALSISGVTANNKVYDRLTTATLDTASDSLDGVISGDTIDFDDSSATGSFANKTVGTAKAVTASGFAISGADASNYSLAQPTGLTADITAKGLTISGVTANNKEYDRLTTATLDKVSGSLNGVISGDTVNFDDSAATGSFANKTVGTAKAVTASGFAISGADASNYALSQPTGLTADITAKGLTISGVTANNKVYDRLTTATLDTSSDSLNGVISGDTVDFDDSVATGSFANKNVGNAKTVTATGFAISGADASNYSLAQPMGLTANITAKALSANVTADNKVYDGNATASGSTGSLIGVISGDTVNFTGTDAYSFVNKNAGIDKLVTETGLSITGADAANYALGTLSTTADITAKDLSITGVTANNKVYDRLVAVSLDTTSMSLFGLVSGDTITLGDSSAAASFDDKNAGTGKAVTASGFAISGADASNYNLAQPTGLTADITAKFLSASVTADNKVYDRTTAAAGATGSLQGIILGDTVSFTGTDTYSFSDRNVGAGKTVTETGLSLAGADANNYTLSALTGTANITAKGLTISGVTANNKEYDRLTAASLNTASDSLDGVISGDTVTFDDSTATGSFANKNVGTGKTVTTSGFAISGADASNYALSQPTGLTADITTKALSIIGVIANNKTYDRLTTASLNTAGDSLSGVISGDAVTLNNGSASGSFADKTVGAGKAVTASGFAISGSDAGNYALSQPTGLAADITAKALSILGVTANNKVYDRLTSALLNTASDSLGGVISGDTVTLDNSGASGSFANKTVGTAKTVTASGFAITGGDAGNYALNQPTGLAANITAKGLTISGVTANNKVYDRLTAASLDTSGDSLNGVISGDTVTFDDSAASGSFANKNVGNAKTVTASGFAISDADSSNYALSQPTGLTANITAKTLSILGVTSNNKVYDRLTTASLNTAGDSLSGVISGDTVTLNNGGASGSFADKTVGTAKAVTAAGFAIAGGDASNYALNQPTGVTANITAKHLTVLGVTANNKVYDRLTSTSLNTSGDSLDGVISGDTVTFDDSAASGSFADKTVGADKAVTASGFAISGADAANYALSQPTGLFANITAKALSLAGIAANNKTYDGLLTAGLNTSGQSLVGVVSGDTVNINNGGASAAFSNKNVGTAKVVSASGFAINGADASNYTLSQPSGLTANIAAKGLTVTAEDKSKAYGGSEPGLTYIYSGLVGGDTSASFTGALARAVGENAGTYVIGQNTLAAAGNYVISSFVPGVLTISQAANLIVTVNNKTKRYGEANPVFDLSFSGLVNGDLPSMFTGYSLSTLADTASNVGSYIISLTGGSAGNYTLTRVNGTLSVTPALLTIRANDAARIRGQANPAFTATYSGFMNGQDASIVSGLNLSTLATMNSDAGIYSIMPAGATAPNYAMNFVNGLLNVEALTVASIPETALHITIPAAMPKISFSSPPPAPAPVSVAAPAPAAPANTPAALSAPANSQPVNSEPASEPAMQGQSSSSPAPSNSSDDADEKEKKKTSLNSKSEGKEKQANKKSGPQEQDVTGSISPKPSLTHHFRSFVKLAGEIERPIHFMFFPASDMSRMFLFNADRGFAE